jgi:hypothetical protein
MTAQKESLTSKGFWKRHLDKIGVGGSLFAALCPRISRAGVHPFCDRPWLFNQ